MKARSEAIEFQFLATWQVEDSSHSDDDGEIL
jgi:hypothetical protein